ncbi:hypothetical protein ACF3OC_07865 [Sphingobacterium cellulitidis]|uniref:hypothetical protein n=1 Tax=Sphingobacterium cellulitidis TaxID=1768011 RepID=UPI00370DD94E
MKTALIKPKKITQAQKVIDKVKRQVAEVCQHLEWTEEQYYLHQFEQYEEFLKRQLHGYPEKFYNRIRYSPLMRGMWNNEWFNRTNGKFLNMARFHLFEGMEVNENGELLIVEPFEGAREHVNDEYMFIHNGKLLVNNLDFMTRYYHVLELIQKS